MYICIYMYIYIYIYIYILIYILYICNMFKSYPILYLRRHPYFNKITYCRSASLIKINSSLTNLHLNKILH